MPETIFGPRTSPYSNARKIDNNEASVLLHDCIPCSGQPTNIETVLTCIFIPPPGPYKEGWGLGTPLCFENFWTLIYFKFDDKGEMQTRGWLLSELGKENTFFQLPEILQNK